MTDARVQVAADGGAVRIALGGEIDMANAALVEEEISAAITNQVTMVSIDLSDVTYLDSAGLRVLFALVDRLPTLQIALELISPLNSPARRIVELSGLTGIVSVKPEGPHPAERPTPH